MNLTAKEVKAVLKEQIANSRRTLAEMGYSEVPVRARLVSLARRYGGPLLDVGTGACACMAVALARRGLRVTTLDYASSARRMAQERAACKLLVMISKLNRAGCRVTHHLNESFDTKLPDLLAGYCQDCQRFDDAHHVT